MNTVTSKDIEYLIKVGQCNPENINSVKYLMDYLKSRDEVNIVHPTEWESKLVPYTDNDIVNLFKGLVLTERELHWIGGSVASAISVYRIIQKRDLEKNHHIAAFAVKYSHNALVPFGESRILFSFKSAHIRPERIRARNSPNRARNIDRERREEKRSKGNRENEIHRLRKLSYEERGDIRAKLLKKYIDLSIIEKLEIMVGDQLYPPEYYPYEWISVSNDEIENLPIELVKKLCDKLSRKTKGEWKRFRNKLRKYDDGT